MANPSISLLGATYSDVSGVTLPKSGGGTATFPYVEGSQTVTENGTYDCTSLEEVVVDVSGGSSSTVGEATVTPTSSSTSISFSVAGEPIAFSLVLDAQITLSTTRYVMAIHSSGSTTYGIYGYRSGNSSYIYYSASYFSWSYSNGTLTVRSSSSTNGGYFRSVRYRLIYVY